MHISRKQSSPSSRIVTSSSPSHCHSLPRSSLLLYLILFIYIMTATAFIPSQVISSKKKKDGGIDLIPTRTRTIHEHKKSLFLVPSQSINSSNNRKKNKNRTKLQETFDANGNKNQKDASTSTSTSTSTLNTKTQKKTRKHSFQYYGNLPDVHWR